MSNFIKSGIRLWIQLSIFLFFIILIMYLFSDGSIDAVEDVALRDINAQDILAYLPENSKASDSFYDALNNNKKISDVKINIIDISEYVAERSGKVVSFIASRDISELQKNFDIVRVIFKFEENKQVNIDFLVLKGSLFGFLDSKRAEYVKPWATVLGIIDTSMH